MLFGAVSISQAYRDASRGLMASYLSGRASHELAPPGGASYEIPRPLLVDHKSSTSPHWWPI